MGARRWPPHPETSSGHPRTWRRSRPKVAELGPAADVFAAGAMLYELLSGRLPYAEDGGALAIVYRHVYEDPIPLADVAPHVPPTVAAATMRALARRPEDRYPSAEAFGVAVGEAATAAWGPGWMRQSHVSLMAPGPILSSADRPTLESEAARPPSEVAPDIDPRSTLPGGAGVPLPPPTEDPSTASPSGHRAGTS